MANPAIAASFCGGCGMELRRAGEKYVHELTRTAACPLSPQGIREYLEILVTGQRVQILGTLKANGFYVVSICREVLKQHKTEKDADWQAAKVRERLQAHITKLIEAAQGSEEEVIVYQRCKTCTASFAIEGVTAYFCPNCGVKWDNLEA